MAHARSAPRPAPTLSQAGLGESTWSVERQRAAWAPRGSDVVEEAGLAGGVVQRLPRWEGRGRAPPWSYVGLCLAQDVRKSWKVFGQLCLPRRSSSPFLLSLQVFSQLQYLSKFYLNTI